MEGWDWNLQIECAESFIKPLEMGLINQKNIEKTITEAVRILKDELSEMNERLLDSWMKVLETCVSRVDMAFVSQNVIQKIMDIVSQNNPLPKRKHGNKLVFTVAKSVGEKGIDKDAQIQRLINNICGDGNYKIRRDGIRFLMEYLRQSREEILASPRFTSFYLPLIFDFANDEDMHIQLDAVEVLNLIIDQLSAEEVEDVYVACVLNFLTMDSEDQIEITERVAELFGEMAAKLQQFGLHMKYKEQFIAYFKSIYDHKEKSIRQKAAFNLPCMNLLFKPVEKEMEISFADIYLALSEDEEPSIRYCAAASLHEAFKIIDPEEDTSSLRKCFLSFIVENQRDLMELMNEHLVDIVSQYANKHAVENFKNRTPYVESSSDNGSKETTPRSRQSKTSNNTDFSAALLDSSHKKGLTKKNTNLGINDSEFDDNVPKLPPIYLTPDRKSELVYSDLLQRLMVLITNMKSNTGLWREHWKLLSNLRQVLHLFYMPEVHSYLAPLLFEFVQEGNDQMKEITCDCLATILKHQHHSASRENLLQRVQQQLAQAPSWQMRKAFIIFCKYAAQQMPTEFFKKHFLKDLIACSSDKVPQVRREFASGLLIIKPFFDQDVNLSIELMDLLNGLANDSDRSVVEAVEHTDYELLQQRKKNKCQADMDEEKI